MRIPKTPYEEYKKCWNRATGTVDIGNWKYAVYGIVYVILALVSGAYIIFGFGFKVRNANIQTDKIVYINSFDDFKNNLTDPILSKTYQLQIDIELTEKTCITIGSLKYPFTGIFDGGGHTITYNYGAESGYKSLFGYVAKNAEIKGLRVCGSLELQEGEVGAAIAAYNYGTISNCSVGIDKKGEEKSFSVTVNNYATAGGIAAYNYGAINDCTARMQVSKSGTGGVMKTFFGGMCAKNIKDEPKDYEGLVKGEVKSDIVFNGFDETDVFNNYDEFDGGNFYMGAAIGSNDGVTQGVIYAADRGAYLSDRAILVFVSPDEYNQLLKTD